MTSIIPREYSRKAEYVYGINKKEHTLANLGQFEDGNPLNNMQKVFRVWKSPHPKSSGALRAATAYYKCAEEALVLWSFLTIFNLKKARTYECCSADE